MNTFIRLYRFKRRCGQTRRSALKAAYAALMRDMQFKRRPL